MLKPVPSGIASPACRHTAHRGCKWDAPTSLSAAAPPSCPGGVSKGGPQPAPLCRFKGCGKSKSPRFSSGAGGHSLFKRISPLLLAQTGPPLRQRPFPLPRHGNVPLREQVLPVPHSGTFMKYPPNPKILPFFSAIWSFRPWKVIPQQKVEYLRRALHILRHDPDEPPGLRVHGGEPHHVRVVFTKALGAGRLVLLPLRALTISAFSLSE